MGKKLVRLAAPAFVVLGTAGLAGLAATPAGASKRPSPKPTPAKVAKRPATHRGTGVVDLRGVVAKIDASAGRLDVRVGKREIAVKATASELKGLKVGETVAVHGRVVHNLRVASSIAKA